MNKPIRESETRTVRGLKELLPDRWKLIKLKLVCDIETGFAFPSEVFGDTGTPVIRITDIKDREINLSEIKRVDDLLLKSKPKRPRVNKGDIIMAMTGATIGKVGYYNSDKPSYLNQRVCRFIPTSIDRGYLWHTLNSEIYKKYIELEAFGGAQANISDSQLLNFPAPLPELEEEQQKIAQFLDYETAKIDALIDEQKRLIELLKEKRQAVISHAVTKGLNPDAPMKDSGVEWLGEVPEHWKVLRVKFLSSKVSTGGTPTQPPPSEEYDDGLNWFSPGDFKDSLMLINSKKKLDRGSLVSNNAMIFPANSVLVVGIGATLGKVAITSEKFSTNQQVNIISPSKSVSKEFLAYSLSVKREAMKVLSNASTIGIMNQEKTKEIPVPIPTFGEQESIHLYIGKELEKLSLLVESTKTNIDLLKERRSALISAAVTGKIDVRDWQPPAGSDTVDSNAAVQTERQYG